VASGRPVRAWLPFSLWVPSASLASGGGGGHRWPVGEAVAKGGQSAKGRLPGGAVSVAPLLAREWLPVVCGQWAKFRLPSGEPIGR
jgi:hypothetical protein